MPTLTYKLLDGFVALIHDRRRILHVGVTAHPTAAWTAQQLREALPGHGTEPRLLLRDSDATYGKSFEECVRSLGLTQLFTGDKSPWQNAHVERTIGTIRRDCLDHILPMGERHADLRRLLQRPAAAPLSQTERAHSANEGTTTAAEVHGTPVLSPLHRRYPAVA